MRYATLGSGVRGVKVSMVQRWFNAESMLSDLQFRSSTHESALFNAKYFTLHCWQMPRSFAAANVQGKRAHRACPIRNGQESLAAGATSHGVTAV